jgi:hypothetical protein
VPPVMSAALVSSPGGGSWAEHTFVPGLRSGDGISRGWVRCRLVRGDLFLERRFLEAMRQEHGFLERRLGSLELRRGFLGLARRRSCSVLSAATWQERSSIPCRGAVLSEFGPTLTSAGWDATS